MSLSDEERRRIDEEERVRAEARIRAEAEARQKPDAEAAARAAEEKKKLVVIGSLLPESKDKPRLIFPEWQH